MSIQSLTLPALVKMGRDKNITGVFTSTKRKGVWVDTSPDDFFNRVKYLALALDSLGIKRGDKVSLHSENSTEWFVTDQAVLSIGAINVPIYTTQPGDQISYIVDNSESKAYVFSSDKMFDGFKPYLKNHDGLITICLIESSDNDCLRYADLLEKGKKIDEENPKLFDELSAQVEPDDLASFIYTSGTTGKPKGVMLTHNNIASNVQYSIPRIPFNIEGERGGKLLSYLPLSHIFERMLNYMYFHIGYPVYYIEELEKIKDDLIAVQPIFFGSVPRLLEKIYTGVQDKVAKSPGAKKKIGQWALGLAKAYDLENPPSGVGALKLKMADFLVYKTIRQGMGGKLIGIISGGAALAPHLMNFYTALGLKCHQGYGLTETSPVLTVTTENAIKAGSSGRAIGGVELKIAEDGEILARGPNIMKGYYKNPEATAEVLSEDGWFSTGDIGKIDDEGFLYITDRKKDIFKLSTGKYVAPQHVENTLSRSKYIEQIVVLGAKQKFCSALIVPNMEAVNDKLGSISNENEFSKKVEALIQKEVDHLNETLPKWEQIKKFALIDDLFSIESGELTPTLKTKRRVVHEKFKMTIEKIYEDFS